MDISYGNKFNREFKKYHKKYNTLKKDLDNLINVLSEYPTGNKSKHWNILRQNEKKYLIKVRMMCRAIKGKSFRVIYYYDGEKLELVFIEIYYKGNKARENTQRMNEFWQSRNND